MEIDYLIIGAGLAGIGFAETALQNNKSVFVIDNNFPNSSKVAAGLYNPVILKRFSGLKNSQYQINLLNFFYGKIEAKLNIKIDYKIPILRKFFSVEEQNNWFIAADKPDLCPFLSLDLISKKYDGIDSPFGYGKVLQSGYVDVAFYIESYKKYLLKNNLFLQESFDYSLLTFSDNHVFYKNIIAKNIIFAEGFGMHSNPYFNNLPLDGTKGELFIIKAPKLVIDIIVNTSVFILPLGNDFYKVGATYNWADKTNNPTEAGKQELITRIKEILNCDFEIIKHLAGVRPTVKDRNPLIGTHSDYKNIHILNGLGTRGVMLAPAMALALFEKIELDKALDYNIDIQRYAGKF